MGFFLWWLLDPKGWGSPNFSYLLWVREHLRRQQWTTSTCPMCSTFSLSASCLIHLPFFPQWVFLLLFWGVHIGGEWTGRWITGQVRVRGGQSRRLNSRVWVWEKRGKKRKKRKVEEEGDDDSESESQHASFALPYVTVSLRSPARADHLIHYLHDLRCLESAARKRYKTVGCWFLGAPSHLPRSQGRREGCGYWGGQGPPLYTFRQRVGVVGEKTVHVDMQRDYSGKDLWIIWLTADQ